MLIIAMKINKRGRMLRTCGGGGGELRFTTDDHRRPQSKIVEQMLMEMRMQGTGNSFPGETSLLEFKKQGGARGSQHE